MIVFVCSPYRGDVKENISLARRLCRKAVLEGNTVICPHLLYPQFLSDNREEERRLGIEAGLSMLHLADEIWVADGVITEGMSQEIARAGELGIPTRCVCDPLATEEHLLNAVISGKE